MKKRCLLVLGIFLSFAAMAEDGYRLWLRYDRISDAGLRSYYQNTLSYIRFTDTNFTATLKISRQELTNALESMVGQGTTGKSGIRIGTIASMPRNNELQQQLSAIGTEGYIIRTQLNTNGKKEIIITANTDKGVLYGVFGFLRLIQTHQRLDNINIVSAPKLKYRILDHWDNLNRDVERGYAGLSIWDWHKLPLYIDQRYIDYARANASIGINGTVLNNVNANALILTPAYLEKVAALANTFRAYGIKIYLTARFSAPMEIGGLSTADPLNEAVQRWWKKKVAEIYQYIPDFGGFLVKANSEGQPGPQNYNRTHAAGANMLADALQPYNGIVMWRAFVYDVRIQQEQENFDSSHTVQTNVTPIASADRFKQAYEQFTPLDGKFRENVMIQVKNGPIDFQPREPFSPLFGAMPSSALMMEFQVTQEYLGQATHLVFLPTMWKEVLDADTYQNGKGSFIKNRIKGIAGVANIGSDRNWTGHPFAQANWYGFGRLAWDASLSAAQVAREWTTQTFGNDAITVNTITHMLLHSHEALVNYMTPMGLHHIMGNSHHYGPAPWSNTLARADWNPVYYHKADSIGIGFNRTASGSNALAQYALPLQQLWGNPSTCPESLLLWFHHISWTQPLQHGKNLWETLCDQYNLGVDSIKNIQRNWQELSGKIDAERFRQVSMLLDIQVKEARWWRDACLLYFQTFSKQNIPAKYEQPEHSLDYYKSLRFPFAPGIGNNH